MPDKEYVLQIPGELMKMSSKINGSWVLTFSTQENIQPEHIARFAEMQHQPSWITVVASPEGLERPTIESKHILDLPSLPKPKENKKSQSQKLRDKLFVYYTKVDSSKESDFEDFYNHWMGKIQSWILQQIKELEKEND